MTPLANVSYVSVTCDVDRLKGVDRARGRLTERERVGVALGDLVKMTVAPALVECGARPGSVRWCGLDDLRTLIRSVSDPAGNADRPPVTRDEPTLGWCEESLDGESVTLESCVARTWWVTQWPTGRAGGLDARHPAGRQDDRPDPYLEAHEHGEKREGPA